MIEIQKLMSHSAHPNLKDNYAKAQKDEIFKQITASLDTSEETLMKNTSKLQDCVVEKKHCLVCPSLIMCKNQVKGFCYLPVVNQTKLSFDYIACPYYLEYQQQNNYYHNVYLFDIAKEIKEASVKQIYSDDKNRTETIKYLKHFYDTYFDIPSKGLYLHGSFGCGKTYLVAAIFNELAKKNVKSAIVYFPEYLRSLKESFQDSNLFKEKFEAIKKAPLLLLDDIGAENVTAWGRDEVLGPILQYRMQEHLPTFFTSNLDIKELEEHYSIANGTTDQVKARRIIERIECLTDDIKMVGANRR